MTPTPFFTADTWPLPRGTMLPDGSRIASFTLTGYWVNAPDGEARFLPATAVHERRHVEPLVVLA